jgi:hypothetical protein
MRAALAYHRRKEYERREDRTGSMEEGRNKGLGWRRIRGIECQKNQQPN